MRAIRLKGRSVTVARVRGTVLTRDQAGLRKGRVLGADDVSVLRAEAEVHLVRLGPGDVHEDEAAMRLSRAVAHAGVSMTAPHQSQVRLVARHRGRLEVDADAIRALNRITGVSVFTLFHGSAVEAGEEVAGTKVTPVAVPESALRRAEVVARGREVIQVVPFRPLRTLIAVTERLRARARAAFAEAVQRKLGWYGAELIGVREVARTEAAMAEVYAEAVEGRVQLMLLAGASSIDPLDPAYSQLSGAGGRLLVRGAPAHPGSMIWLGALNSTVVIGVASCSGFGRNTALDLVLPIMFARGTLSASDLRELGHGGLIEHAAGRRFPPYP
ncbi:MAG TPA: hypothetical protein VNI34_10045 [Candidatus Nitrosotalea sp.]|nr:hypothetical protein [Candidatus Nitrosotalea sp.]